MKLRLAEPKVLVDIGRIGGLRSIREEGGRLVIGALTTHFDLESSALAAAKCPLLPAVAREIGDVQVRNRGTIGGSLAHADPAADWPAAVLALDAEIVIAGPSGERTVAATNFFKGLFETALGEGEILTAIRVPVTGTQVSYVKTRQKASGFALCGVAVRIEGGAAAIAVTGVADRPYRATAAEMAIAASGLGAESVEAASRLAANGIEALGDLHASEEYRAHLARVNTKRALLAAAS
jgi:carbon-monoxide dehydrogenase medium subunit